MNVSNVKNKEGKNKKKAIQKLKTILANPYKERCPVLKEDELSHFANTIRSAMIESGQQPREFINSRRIRLGLESSLRAINNVQVSCVFISLSLKPHHLISLIARNVEVKNSKVPVFAQSKLEDFTESLFGIRALIFVLPKNASDVCENLVNWLDAHKKIVTTKKDRTTKTKNFIKKTQETNFLLSSNVGEKTVETKRLVQIVPVSVVEEKKMSDDFISFSSTTENIKLDRLQLNDDKNQLFGALSKLKSYAKESDTNNVATKTSNMFVFDKIGERDPPPISNTISELNSDSDDFLQEYRNLTVHKIRPNPDKKPKKRRNKNKKKKA